MQASEEVDKIKILIKIKMNKLIINSILAVSLVVGNAGLALAHEGEEDLIRANSGLPAENLAKPAAANDKKAVAQERREAIKDAAEKKREELKNAATEKREAVKAAAQEKREAVKTATTGLKEAAKTAQTEFRAKLELEREAFKGKAEAAKEEFQQKREAQKEELKARLQKVKDEKKKQAVERLDNRFTEINAKMTNHWLNALTRLEELLAKVSSRADRAQANGHDVSATRVAIEKAKAEIAAARTVLEAQLKKTYPINVTDESALKSAAATAREALNKDLKAAQEAVKKAHKAVVDANTSLKKIPKVDELNGKATTTD